MKPAFVVLLLALVGAPEPMAWAEEPPIDRERLGEIVMNPTTLDVVAQPPLALETGLIEWRRGVEGVPLTKPTFWCARAVELDDALVCAGRHPATLRAALLRASVFAEGAEGRPKGTLLPRRNRLALSSRLAGFDLPGKEIEAFLALVEKRCKVDGKKRFCLTAPEQSFFEFVRKEFEAHSGDYAVVVFATFLRDDTHYLGSATHELLHAQYFLDPTYAGVVEEYWDDLPDEDRRSIVDALSAHYDPTDDVLMRNEFQAYLLQNQASTLSPLKQHLAAHAEALRRRARDAGAPALSFDHEAHPSKTGP